MQYCPLQFVVCYVFCFSTHLHPMASRSTPIQPSFCAHVTSLNFVSNTDLANHPASCFSVPCVCSIPQLISPFLSSLYYQSSLVVDVSPNTTAVFSPPSPFFPFSVTIVVVHLRFLFPTRILPTCFISPFFLLCIKWVVCMTLYAESLSRKRESACQVFRVPKSDCTV